MSQVEKALENFSTGMNCAQAVFLAFAEELGLSREEALKLTSCLGGGMCSGEVCGAASAGLLTVGMKNCDANAEISAEEKARMRALGAKFMKAFKERNGSVVCRELAPLGRTHCAKCIQDAVEIVEEMH